MKQIFLILWIGLPFVAFTQKTAFSIEGGVLYYLEETGHREVENEWVTIAPLIINGDDFIERSTVHRTTRHTSKFKPSLAYQLKGNLNLQLTKKAFIQTGISLLYLSTTTSTESTIIDNRIIQKDTIPGEISIIGTSPTLCDVYVNSPQGINVQLDPVVSSYLLSIPLNIGYKINSKMDVSLGVSLITPIYTISRFSYVGLEQYIENDLTHCEYLRRERKDENDGLAQDLQFAANFNISYSLSENIYLNASFQNHLNNFFHQREQENSLNLFVSGRSYHYDWKPTSIAFSIGYYL